MRYLILFFTFIIVNQSFSQRMVRSGAYNATLKTLLSHTVNEVSVMQIERMQDTTAIAYIDAREKSEYNVSHIKNAVWVGYDNFDIKRVTDVVPKDKKVIVYCSVGYRSEKIAEGIRNSGYTDVSNLYGGIFEWKNEGLPVYNEEGETERVHAYDKVWGVWLKKGVKVYR